MAKVISNNNNKLQIQLDQPLPTPTPKTPTQSTTMSTSPSPQPTSPTPSKINTHTPKIIKKQQRVASDTDEDAPSPSLTPNKKQKQTNNNKGDNDAKSIAKLKREQCIFKNHSTKMGETELRTKSKQYSKSVELTNKEAADPKLRQMKIKQESKVKLFGTEEELVVARVSLPIAGVCFTLYVYSKTKSEVLAVQLTNITELLEGDATTAEQQPLEKWWEDIIKDAGDKKEEVKEKEK